MTTYQIIRFFEDGRKQRITSKLSEKQAKDWCNNPETLSYTAQPPHGCGSDPEQIAAWHKEEKHWFDGFEKED